MKSLHPEKVEVPKDLKVKIGTKKEAWWTATKRQTEELIEDTENNLIIQKEILKLAILKLKEEKEKDLNKSGDSEKDGK